jgi:hypothetical protein
VCVWGGGGVATLFTASRYPMGPVQNGTQSHLFSEDVAVSRVATPRVRLLTYLPPASAGYMVGQSG